VKKEIIINVEPNETRIGIKEDGELVEYMVERSGDRVSVGDIYKARVTAVLPGMQAAFLDIGTEKSAFLHISDMGDELRDFEDMDDSFDADDDVPRSQGDRGGKGRGGGGRGQAPKPMAIEDMLSKGDEVLVQLTKEPIGTKGSRVSTQISLPGRYMVLMPGTGLVGISRKIDDREERQRIKEIVRPLKPSEVGVIVRTAGVGMGKKQFESDIKFLMKLWKKISKRAQKARTPSLVHKDMEIITRLVRDIFTEDVTRIVVDSKKEHKEILSYLRSAAPKFRDRVHYYREDTPIFDAYEIERDTERILSRIVPLKKGGFISIDHTEALVAIDVNTGRYRGAKDQEETALRTNLQAAVEVARQLRLRDLGGIIVIDFIDMALEENRKKVLDELRAGLKLDRSRTKTLRVSEMGLVEMTRQRVRPSLGQMMSEICSACGGSGRVLSLESIEMRLDRMLKRLKARISERRIEIYLTPEVAFHMLSDRSRRIMRLEKQFGMEIDIKDDASLKRTDVVVRSSRTREDLSALIES
jgi:ribonuclease G